MKIVNLFNLVDLLINIKKSKFDIKEGNIIFIVNLGKLFKGKETITLDGILFINQSTKVLTGELILFIYFLN